MPILKKPGRVWWGGLGLDCKLLRFVSVSCFYPKPFFFRCLLSQVLLSWLWGKPFFECLNILVFRILLCVSFSLSKLSLLDRLLVTSQSKGRNLHSRRKLVWVRGSFVHQNGLPEGIFWRLLWWHLLLLLILHIWLLSVFVYVFEIRTKVQEALEYNPSLPSVWPSLTISHSDFNAWELQKDYRNNKLQPFHNCL
jgi:hypothetical protein